MMEYNMILIGFASYPIVKFIVIAIWDKLEESFEKILDTLIVDLEGDNEKHSSNTHGHDR
jgi:hypothetical protein